MEMRTGPPHTQSSFRLRPARWARLHVHPNVRSTRAQQLRQEVFWPLLPRAARGQDGGRWRTNPKVSRRAARRDGRGRRPGPLHKRRLLGWSPLALLAAGTTAAAALGVATGGLGRARCGHGPRRLRGLVDPGDAGSAHRRSGRQRPDLRAGNRRLDQRAPDRSTSPRTRSPPISPRGRRAPR